MPQDEIGSLKGMIFIFYATEIFDERAIFKTGNLEAARKFIPNNFEKVLKPNREKCILCLLFQFKKKSLKSMGLRSYGQQLVKGAINLHFFAQHSIFINESLRQLRCIRSIISPLEQKNSRDTK